VLRIGTAPALEHAVLDRYRIADALVLVERLVPCEHGLAEREFDRERV